MTYLPGTDLPPRGTSPWYDLLLAPWNVLRGKAKEHDDLLTTGRLSATKVDERIDQRVAASPANAAVRLTNEPTSTSVHGWHTGPQHIHLDGFDYIGGIEGEADADGNSAVTVDVLDYQRNKATRVEAFRMPVDDHSPAGVIGAPGCPVSVAAVPHQTGRSLRMLTLFVNPSTGAVTKSATTTFTLPNPSDIGATTTYVQMEVLNPDTALADGFTTLFVTVRLAWHWFGGIVRKDNVTGAHSIVGDWFDFMTFRDPGFPADGTQLQGYLNVYRRASGVIDVLAFGHPTLSVDRDIYATTIDVATGSVGGGIANIYTGAGLPINRRQMEIAYKRVPNTNNRCLGVGGLAKRQAIISKWDTSSGTTAATTPNNRYKMLTRGNAPANPGLALTSAGYAASADRAAYDTTNIGAEVYVIPTSTRPAAAGDVASKWNASAQRSWRLFLNTDGTLSLSVSSDGTATITLTSSAPVPTTGVKGLGVGYVASTGVATFYWYDGTTWQQVGTTVGSTPTPVFNSTTSLQIGRAGGTNSLPGTYQRFAFRNGWGVGTLVADVDFLRGWADGETAGTSRVDYLANSWALQAGAVVSAIKWDETADLGPTGDPVGYDNDIQYISGAMQVWRRDDAALVARRMPGGLSQVVEVRVTPTGVVTEEVLAESLEGVFFRPISKYGNRGQSKGSASLMYQYGPVYTQFSSIVKMLWQRGPIVAGD